MDLSSQPQTTDSFPLLYHQNPTSSSSSILHAPDIHHLISKYHNPASASASASDSDSNTKATGFDHSKSTLDGQAGHHLQPLMWLGAAAMASYYQDPAAAQQHSWMLKEAIRQYGMPNPLAYAPVPRPQIGMEQMMAANLNPMLWIPGAVHSFPNGAWKKGPKRTKIVQSAWCEVCKIDCNSQEVLNNHKAGKKHKKNLEKLQDLQNAASSAPAPAPAPSPLPTPADATPKPKKRKAAGKKKRALQENLKCDGAQARKGAPPSEPGEDLETKKRKLMEGGAPADSVRVCEICHVACNSQTVFDYHLAGQKHAAQVKKHAKAVAAAKAQATSAAGATGADDPSKVTAS